MLYKQNDQTQPLGHNMLTYEEMKTNKGVHDVVKN